MAFDYTIDQQKVIDLQGRNILVAAAAGSGKTAVLVERIVKMITKKENPISIDQLLVVTFTSAAASEMRERIGAAIEKQLDKHPQDEHLQKQVTLIHNAQITTISSFCLSIVKNHFQDIGLEPNFRIADEGEAKLLKQDILAEVLEEQFAEKSKEFLDFVEATTTNTSEKAMEEMILKLYEASRSYPFPEKWLEECKKQYFQESTESFVESPWINFVETYIGKMIEGIVLQIEQAIGICEESSGPYFYVDLLNEERDMFLEMRKYCRFEEIGDALSKVVFGKLPSKKDESVSLIKRERVKEIRGQVKEVVTKLKDDFYYDTIRGMQDYLNESYGVLSVLINVTILFGKRFLEKKQEKGILDFSDMEHYALEILLQEKDGRMVPTETAKVYQEYFSEILIDEYQDSNLVQEYLLKSISKESMGIYNQFMVGDVKQSIYKFRLARPELFMEKYHTYSTEDSLMQKIDLHKNFRSREEVLSCVNTIFERIMMTQIGGIAYDKDAALYLGATYDRILEQDQKAELLVMEQEEGGLEKKELEARGIAKKIKSMMTSFKVVDQETGVARLAKYSDIVILLRSNAGWDDVFKEVLESEGIPTHIASKTGYFNVYEVQIVLNYLRILDNPLQDIPLAAVLLSPMIGFSEDDLAYVKGIYKNAAKGKRKKKFLYELLKEYLELERGSYLAGRIKLFLTTLDDYRNMIPYMPIHELMIRFIKELGFQLFFTSMPGGEQRKANLEMLLEKAIQFEHTSYHGLFHFIRYIEQMEKFEVNFGEANILDEYADVVRIMSIHKSKGLEFPICFVSGTAKQFNQMDLRKNMVVDMDFGIGMDYCNPTERIKSKTIRKAAIIRKMELDNLGEELRILYVALTRAKEKLIMTGTVSDWESMVEKNVGVKPSFLTIKQCKNFLELILLGMGNHLRESNYFTITKILEEDFAIDEVRESMGALSSKKLLLEEMESYTNTPLWNRIESQLSYEYEHDYLSQLYSKTTVSEIKHKRIAEELEDAKELFPETTVHSYMPKFLQKEHISGTERGNAYHKAMEVIDFGIGIDPMKSLAEKVAYGRMSTHYYDLLQVDKIKGFFQTPLSERMQRAAEQGMLYKEQPFVIALPANEVEVQFPKEEQILLQGIVDAYFEEDGELIIVDYKTDRIDTGEELLKRYHTQLEYYSKALSQITGKKVKECILYSFALEKEVSAN